MGTHLTSAIWGPFWVFGSPFEAQERVKSQCSHVDHLIICESKISFNEFHASLQWNWYLYFKTFYYKELVCRLASGVLSNIDHQKKKPEYRPNIDHTALYRPNIDHKSSLKSAYLHVLRHNPTSQEIHVKQGAGRYFHISSF